MTPDELEVLCDLVEAENVERTLVASDKKLKWHKITQEFARRTNKTVETDGEFTELNKALQNTWSNEK